MLAISSEIHGWISFIFGDKLPYIPGRVLLNIRWPYVKGQGHQRSLKLFPSLFQCNWTACHYENRIARYFKPQMLVYGVPKFQFLTLKFYPRSKVKVSGHCNFHHLNFSRAVNIWHRKSGIGSKCVYWNSLSICFIDFSFLIFNPCGVITLILSESGKIR